MRNGALTRSAVARGGGDEDSCRRGVEEGALHGVGVDAGGAGEGVADHVHAIGHRLVDRRDGVGRGAPVVGGGRGGPARLVDGDAGAGGHPRDAPEVVALDPGPDPVVPRGDGCGVRAVTAAVTGGEVLRGGEVLLAEALHEVARRDHLAVAVGLVPLLTGRAVAAEARGAAAVCTGQRREAGVLGPDAAVDDAHHRAAARAVGAARGRPGVLGPQEAGGVHRVQALLGAALHEGDLGVGAKLLDLVTGQLGGEAVHGRCVAVEHGGPAELLQQGILRLAEAGLPVGRVHARSVGQADDVDTGPGDLGGRGSGSGHPRRTADAEARGEQGTGDPSNAR